MRLNSTDPVRTAPLGNDESRRFHRCLTEAVPRLLPDFLRRQRWFGGKGRTLSRTELEDIAWIKADPPRGIAVVRVEYAEAPADRYALLLGFFDRADVGQALGRCDVLPDRPWLVECSGDPAAAAALLEGFCDRGELPTAGGGAIRYGDVERGSDRALSIDVLKRRDVRLLGAEQSNTMLRVGPGHVFKLFRRIEEGENPEAELTRFLTRATDFAWCSALRGSISYVKPRSAAGTVGVLEDWVPNQGDGWTYVLRTLREMREKPGSAAILLDDLRGLGRITAGFHAALASARSEPGFRPDPITEEGRSEAHDAIRERTSRLLQRLHRRLRELAPDRRSLAKDLLDAGKRIGRLEPPDLAAPDRRFLTIRIHGDYHLGQTLKTDRGFVIIDFEGEPACSLAERKMKQSALRDVAGMLRSFDYAGDVAAGRDTAGPGAWSGGAPPVAVTAMRRAYLEGYERETGASAPYLPRDPGARRGWLRFYELWKALYEVEYEMDNRPDWIDIPLRGIRRLIGEGDRPDGGGS